jgi:hypothetical protein
MSEFVLTFDTTGRPDSYIYTLYAVEVIGNPAPQIAAQSQL